MDSDFTSTRIPEGTRPPGAQRRRQRDPFAIDLDPETADVLVRIYLERRLKYQMDYYDRRASEFENRYDLNYRMGAILMTISTFLASIGVLADQPIFALLTAAIPAFVTFINAFGQLYQWDRISALYRDTVLNLEEVKLSLPDDDRWQATTAVDGYTQLIAKAEQVFKKEADNWGQLAQGRNEDGTVYDPVQDFIEKYGTSLLDENGNVDLERIGELEHILKASQQVYSPPSVRQTQEISSVSELSSTLSASGELAMSISADSPATASPNSTPLLGTGEHPAVVNDTDVASEDPETEDDDPPTSIG